MIFPPNLLVFQMVSGRVESSHQFYLQFISLEELSDSGVGCYWGHMFAGALCYADDIVILAPCASALRRMLEIYMLMITVSCSMLVNSAYLFSFLQKLSLSTIQ